MISIYKHMFVDTPTNNPSTFDCLPSGGQPPEALLTEALPFSRDVTGFSERSDVGVRAFCF